MSRKTPTQPHLPGATVLRVTAGETIHIGPDVQIHTAQADDGHALLSIWAPRNLSIDRAKNFRPSRNSDGQGAPTPQPSAKQSPSSTRTQE